MIRAITTEQTPLAGFVKSPHQPSRAGWISRGCVKKGLAKDPEDRYQSATEMLDRLEARAEGKIPVQCHITFVKRVNGEWGRFVDRHPIVVTMGMAAVAIALVVNVVAALMHHGG